MAKRKAASKAKPKAKKKVGAKTKYIASQGLSGGMMGAGIAYGGNHYVMGHNKRAALGAAIGVAGFGVGVAGGRAYTKSLTGKGKAKAKVGTTTYKRRTPSGKVITVTRRKGKR